MNHSRLTILVSGMIAGDPFQGGAAWAVLQYVLGLRRLGHRVVLVEPIKAASVQPAAARLEESINASYFSRVAGDFGLEEACLLLAGTRTTVGLSYQSLAEIANRADLLINISGMLTDETLLEGPPLRVYLDLDPAFIQCWHEQGIDMRFDGHTHFVTIGQNLGETDCPVPTCGCQWIKTLQPIVLAHWPVAEELVYDGLTTIGNWRGYGSVEHRGVHYGQKAHSLRPLMDLPRRTSENIFLAMSIHPGETEDLKSLGCNGWKLLDPAQVAGTPQAYQRFVQGSKAEVGIAKSGYVLSRVGWFSDRSVCYLASGRPVIAQETGFNRYLPTGQGLLAFRDADELLAAIEALQKDYSAHRRAARALAEEFFNSDRVLTTLLERLGAMA
jgi:hypothetical protein